MGNEDMNQLFSSLKKAGLILTRDIDQEKEDFILPEVDIATFEALFEDVKKNPTYEALFGSHTFK